MSQTAAPALGKEPALQHCHLIKLLLHLQGKGLQDERERKTRVWLLASGRGKHAGGNCDGLLTARWIILLAQKETPFRVSETGALKVPCRSRAWLSDVFLCPPRRPVCQPEPAFRSSFTAHLSLDTGLQAPLAGALQ